MARKKNLIFWFLEHLIEISVCKSVRQKEEKNNNKYIPSFSKERKKVLFIYSFTLFYCTNNAGAGYLMNQPVPAFAQFKKVFFNFFFVFVIICLNLIFKKQSFEYFGFHYGQSHSCALVAIRKKTKILNFFINNVCF